MVFFKVIAQFALACVALNERISQDEQCYTRLMRFSSVDVFSLAVKTNVG